MTSKGILTAAAFLALLSLHASAAPYPAETFSYWDDFGTDKAMEDCWMSSGFCKERPEIQLGGLLSYDYFQCGYAPPSRSLVFYEGSTLCGGAFIAYETLPTNAITTGGHIESCLLISMDFWRSHDGVYWTLLDSKCTGGAGGPVSTSIPAGLPLQYLKFEQPWGTDTCVMDDLSIVIDYVPDPIGGDANLDGEVGIGDLTALATHYDRTGMTWCEGDFTRDGAVTLGDLTILATNYGTGSGGQAVPEPATLSVLLAGAIVLSRRKHRT